MDYRKPDVKKFPFLAKQGKNIALEKKSEKPIFTERFLRKRFSREMHSPLQVEWPAVDDSLAGELFIKDPDLAKDLKNVKNSLKDTYLKAAKKARFEGMVDIEKDPSIPKELNGQEEDYIRKLRNIYEQAEVPDIDNRIGAIRKALIEAAQTFRTRKPPITSLGRSPN